MLDGKRRFYVENSGDEVVIRTKRFIYVVSIDPSYEWIERRIKINPNFYTKVEKPQGAENLVYDIISFLRQENKLNHVEARKRSREIAAHTRRVFYKELSLNKMKGVEEGSYI